MLTYTIEKKQSKSIYEQLYQLIKTDILNGVLKEGDKLPSKRMLAEHLKISVITVKNAYEQLIAEGYIYSIEKKGYYVHHVDEKLRPEVSVAVKREENDVSWFMDFVTNTVSPENFPFTVWSKIMRQTILDQGVNILNPTPYNGAYELRKAISDYLLQFRGMDVTPEQVIIGAGTEFLYHLIIELLGRDKTYAVEHPGYNKINMIYQANQVKVEMIPLDGTGISIDALKKSSADVVHISPSHHYPTGQIMPIGRRQELLKWADQEKEHYILEDDYDSEFRFIGRPIPTLFSIDDHDKVIYVNTFSKTLAPSIRISYLILPRTLLEEYRKKLSFYSCTVSAFEQYTLAKFISDGHYEKHLSRMKNRYRQRKETIISQMKNGPLKELIQIFPEDIGLHFMVKIKTELSDEQLKNKAAKKGIRIAMLSDYYHGKTEDSEQHIWIVNYSGIPMEKLEESINRIYEILKENQNER